MRVLGLFLITCLNIRQAQMTVHQYPIIFLHLEEDHDIKSRSLLSKEQHKDPEISPLFQKAVSETDLAQDPICVYIKNRILMRKWCSPEVPADDEWAVNHQIVVPKVYRSEILSLAHETPMSGHLGINKTYHKILNHFY